MKMTSNGKTLNYKVVDLVESYNFHIKFTFIRVQTKNYKFLKNRLDPYRRPHGARCIVLQFFSDNVFFKKKRKKNVKKKKNSIVLDRVVEWSNLRMWDRIGPAQRSSSLARRKKTPWLPAPLLLSLPAGVEKYQWVSGRRGLAALPLLRDAGPWVRRRLPRRWRRPGGDHHQRRRRPPGGQPRCG
jgi:hypothetical protein